MSPRNQYHLPDLGDERGAVVADWLRELAIAFLPRGVLVDSARDYEEAKNLAIAHVAGIIEGLRLDMSEKDATAPRSKFAADWMREAVAAAVTPPNRKHYTPPRQPKKRAFNTMPQKVRLPDKKS
jgi:hypothetical protein